METRTDGEATQRLIYAPGLLGPVAELQTADREETRFVYASRVNVPEYMVRGGRTFRLVTDQVGSVRFVVDSSTGEIAQEISYDPFGEVVSDSAPGFQPFGFAGGLYSSETGLTHFGAREYDAGLGRWTSSDPISFGGGDTNLYGYVIQDPVNLTDPSGLIIRLIVGAAVLGGGAIGGALNAYEESKKCDSTTLSILRRLGTGAAGGSVGTGVGIATGIATGGNVLVGGAAGGATSEAITGALDGDVSVGGVAGGAAGGAVGGPVAGRLVKIRPGTFRPDVYNPNGSMTKPLGKNSKKIIGQSGVDTAVGGSPALLPSGCGC